MVVSSWSLIGPDNKLRREHHQQPRSSRPSTVLLVSSLQRLNYLVLLLLLGFVFNAAATATATGVHDNHKYDNIHTMQSSSARAVTHPTRSFVRRTRPQQPCYVGGFPFAFVAPLATARTHTSLSTSTTTPISTTISHCNKWHATCRNNIHCHFSSTSSNNDSKSSSNYKKSKSSNSKKNLSNDPFLDNISDKDSDGHYQLSGYRRRQVQWYPGHIAKAERLLKDTFLKAVDVVVEVRDARIPQATSHPSVGLWCAQKPRLVVLTHLDHVPKSSVRAWTQAYDQFGANRELKALDYQDDAPTVDEQIVNQAKQAARERAKYTTNSNSKNKNNKSPQNDNDDNSAVIAPVQEVLFINAQQGEGVQSLIRSISQAGAHVQERRARRGLKERALRVGILGYPNVGKSAVINRLLNRRRAKSANIPGVTRALQWIRIRSDTSNDASGRASGPSAKKKNEFELLDSPGIIPLSLNSVQSDALLLAACNCIGDSAYDNQHVASYLCDWILAMHRLGYKHNAPGWRKACMDRYRFDPLEDKKVSVIPPVGWEDWMPPPEDMYRPHTGEDMLYTVADQTCQGDPEDAARKILQDFRRGRMGPICLQIAPETDTDRGQVQLIPGDEAQDQARQEEHQRWAQQMQMERAQAARDAAEQLGLELPPVLLQREKEQSDDSHTPNPVDDTQVGKGLFDGW